MSNNSTKPFYNTQIPKDWEVKKLIDNCLIKGQYGINAAAIDYSEEFPTYLRITDIDDDGKYSTNKKVSVSDQSSVNYILEKGDIVFARTGATVGKTYLYNENDGQLVFAGFLIRFRPDENKLLVQYLKFFTESRSFWDWVKTVSMRSGQPGINAEEYGSLKIPLPPLPEQRAIAQVLSTADAAIHTTQKLIAQKELRKKWLMQQLLTGKKRLKGFENTKWHLKSLEEVAEFKNGKAHENTIDENGKYIVVNSKFISTEGKVFKCSNENLCPLLIDDIVMVMSDIPNGKALAKCYYIKENNKYTLNQRICSIRVLENADSKFLFFILNRNVHYLSFDNGVGQTNLKKEEVLECPLLIPEKEEQTAIAQVLQAADKEIQLLKAKTDKLKEQKKGLMQVLLTGKKRLNYE